MDPLSDALMAMRVRSGLYTRLELTAPWGLSFGQFAEHADFGLVTEGRCWVTVEGEARSSELAVGDCWLLPRGRAHLLRDSLHSQVVPYSAVYKQKVHNLLRFGKGGDRTTILCGNFFYDQQEDIPWLTHILPPLMVARPQRKHESSTAKKILEIFGPESSGDLVSQGIADFRSPYGSGVVAGHMADLLFVYVIRNFLASNESTKPGWFYALSDRQIGLALRAMHADLQRSWTTAELASIAKISRSVFFVRFTGLVGESPLRYLTRWRMQAAKRLLRDDCKLAVVACQIGYESETAFQKAFRRVVGVSPGQYRVLQRVRNSKSKETLPKTGSRFEGYIGCYSGASARGCACRPLARSRKRS